MWSAPPSISAPASSRRWSTSPCPCSGRPAGGLLHRLHPVLGRVRHRQFLLSQFDVTLPVVIWSLLRTGLNPVTNAVGTFVFAVSIGLVVLVEAAAWRGGGAMAEARWSVCAASPRATKTATAVSQIDLDIAAGEFVVLLGPSGSGKTTVLSMIGGFTAPTTGRVFIDGVDVTDTPPARRPTATVFQDYALFPHMSVRANVGFGLAMRKVPKAERNRRADEVLRLVGPGRLRQPRHPPALRRPAAAGGAGPRDRRRAEGAAARRAAGRARSGAAPADAGRAGADAARASAPPSSMSPTTRRRR